VFRVLTNQKANGIKQTREDLHTPVLLNPRP